MLGIADYGTFCAAILVFLALSGPASFALLTSTVKGGFKAGAAATRGVIEWRRYAVSTKVGAHRKLARALERLAGGFLLGFGIRLGAQ